MKKITMAAVTGFVGWIGLKVYDGAQTIREVFTAIRLSRNPRDSNWICAWETGKCFAELAWIWAEQKLNRTCIQKGNLYHLTFYIEGKLYRICIRPKRGPEDSSSIEPFITSPANLSALEPYIRGYHSIVKPTLKNLNLKGVFVRTEEGTVDVSPEQSLVDVRPS